MLKIKYASRYVCLVLMVLCSLSVNSFEHTLQFSEAQLQQKLQALTPIERQTLLANIVLTDAKLQLLTGSNELEITAFIDVTALGNIHGSGQVRVQGSVSYQATEGAFYLHNARLTKLHIDQLSAKTVEKLQPVVQDLITKSLQSQPIYRLKDNDLRQSLLKASLKRIEVKQKTLYVTLGF